MAKKSPVKKRTATTAQKNVPKKAKTVSVSREKREETKKRGETAPRATRKTKALTPKSKGGATKKTIPRTVRTAKKRESGKKERAQRAETRVIEKAEPAKEAKRAVSTAPSKRVRTAVPPKRDKKESTEPRRPPIEKPAKTAKLVKKKSGRKGIVARPRQRVAAAPQMRKAEVETIPEQPSAIEPIIPLQAAPLPHEYGENYIILTTVNPYRLFTLWEVKEETLDICQGTLLIRLYDVTGVDIDAADALIFEEMPVRERIGKRYFDVSPAREYVAEVGILYDGIFLGIARSSRVSTPVAGVSGEEEFVPAITEVGLRAGYITATNDIAATK